MLRMQLFIICILITSYNNVLQAGGDEQIETNENSLQEIVLSNPDSAQFGEKKFSALCAYCHGNAGSGGKARKLQGRKLEADYVFKTITNGKKRGSLNMPPWRNLPEVVRWQLVAYILSLSEVGK